MPMYQYICKKCDTIFDRRLSISENKLPESEPCPSCNESGSVLQYLGAPPGIHSGEGLASSGKIPSDFREVMQKIRKANPGHNLG